MERVEYSTSIITPFKYNSYKYLWLSALISNICSWMHIVASRWLILSYSNNPFMVGLAQVAMLLPILLFTLPAGMVTDGVKKSKFLLMTQIWMGMASFSIYVFMKLNILTPSTLLLGTLFLGIGTALNIPAWQAFIPLILPEQEVKKAVTLNNISFNIGCFLGPVLGGVLISYFSPQVVFLLDAASYFLVAFYFLVYTHTSNHSMEIPRKITFSFNEVKRNILSNENFLFLIKYVFVFFFSANCIWSLLPIICKLEFTAKIYGLLLGCLGAGAILGGVLVNRLRRSLKDETILQIAIIFIAIPFIFIAFTNHIYILMLSLFCSGYSWISTSSTLNANAIKLFPKHLHSRALAIYMIFFNGSLALSGLFWTKLAAIYHYQTIMLISIFFLLTFTFINRFLNFRKERKFIC